MNNHKTCLRTAVEQRDRLQDLWTIHVDELEDWKPQQASFDSWFDMLSRLYDETRHLVGDSAVVAAVFGFEVSQKLEQFERLTTLPVDFFTPPSLYILNTPLQFPSAREQYYRIINSRELQHDMKNKIVLVRSARDFHGPKDLLEFDNAIYIASHFGDSR